MDETFLSVKNRKMKVVVPAEAMRGSVIDSEMSSHHITLVLCIAADGTAERKSAARVKLAIEGILLEWYGIRLDHKRGLEVVG